MATSMNEVAEIEAVSIVNSFDETVPRTQTAATFDLQTAESTSAHKQAATSRWTTVWQALSSGQSFLLLLRSAKQHL